MQGMPSNGSNIDIDSNGVVTWNIPTEGTYTFTAVATNAFGNSTPVTFYLTITTPSIIDVTLANGMVGSMYSHTFTAGGVSPFTWSFESGTLPTGVDFDPDTATLSGIPTTAGTYNFQIRVTNIGGYAQESFSFTVAPKPLGAPVITTGSSLDGEVGTVFSQSFSATGDPTIS